jgi:hypothetical protein
VSGYKLRQSFAFSYLGVQLSMKASNASPADEFASDQFGPLPET